MALLPANPRDQKFAGMAFVAIALAVVYYMYVWDPANIVLNETQTRIDSLLVINQRAKAELAQGKTAQLRAEVAQYTRDLDVMRLLVPTSNEVPALLDQVSTAARRVGLDISDVQPLPQLTGDQYDAYKYRLSVRGEYHKIALLLTNIGSLQRIVAPINVTLTPLPPDPKLPKKARSQLLDARFEIQTYVSRAMPANAATRAAEAAEKPKPGERE